MTLIHRRAFHRVALGSFFLPLLARPSQAAEKASQRFAVSTWSFHNYFPNTR